MSIPFTRIARDEIGHVMTANMVALGAIAHYCPLIGVKSMEKAVMARAPKGTKTMNNKAFKAGVAAAGKGDVSKLPKSIVTDQEEEI